VGSDADDVTVTDGTVDPSKDSLGKGDKAGHGKIRRDRAAIIGSPISDVATPTADVGTHMTLLPEAFAGSRSQCNCASPEGLHPPRAGH